RQRRKAIGRMRAAMLDTHPATENSEERYCFSSRKPSRGSHRLVAIRHVSSKPRPLPLRGRDLLPCSDDGIREHTMLRRCRLDLLLRLLRFFRRRLRMFLLSLSVRLERQLHENREVVGAAVRSEERRVGKECGSVGVRNHEKQKDT